MATWTAHGCLLGLLGEMLQGLWGFLCYSSLEDGISIIEGFWVEGYRRWAFVWWWLGLGGQGA